MHRWQQQLPLLWLQQLPKRKPPLPHTHTRKRWYSSSRNDDSILLWDTALQRSERERDPPNVCVLDFRLNGCWGYLATARAACLLLSIIKCQSLLPRWHHNLVCTYTIPAANNNNNNNGRGWISKSSIGMEFFFSPPPPPPHWHVPVIVVLLILFVTTILVESVYEWIIYFLFARDYVLFVCTLVLCADTRGSAAQHSSS